MRDRLTALLPEQLCITTDVLQSPDHRPGSALPQKAQRSAATSTTDKSISQVSKYSPQTGSIAHETLVPTARCFREVIHWQAFQGERQKEGQREKETVGERFKPTEAEEREMA